MLYDVQYMRTILFSSFQRARSAIKSTEKIGILILIGFGYNGIQSDVGSRSYFCCSEAGVGPLKRQADEDYQGICQR